jgi:hypothetical protein
MSSVAEDGGAQAARGSKTQFDQRFGGAIVITTSCFAFGCFRPHARSFCGASRRDQLIATARDASTSRFSPKLLPPEPTRHVGSVAEWPTSADAVCPVPHRALRLRLPLLHPCHLGLQLFTNSQCRWPNLCARLLLCAQTTSTALGTFSTRSEASFGQSRGSTGAFFWYTPWALRLCYRLPRYQLFELYG